MKRLAKRALKYRNELFTFLLVPGVEPTNNIAEGALRPCVRQRKGRKNPLMRELGGKEIPD